MAWSSHAILNVFNAGDHRTWHQEHAWPATKRAIVHLPMRALGEITDVRHADIEQAPGARQTEQASLEEACKHIREKGQNVDAHRKGSKRTGRKSRGWFSSRCQEPADSSVAGASAPAAEPSATASTAITSATAVSACSSVVDSAEGSTFTSGT